MHEKDINFIKVMVNNEIEIEVPEGISLLELSEMVENKKGFLIVAGKVDHDIKELNYHLSESCRVEFIDLSDNDGMRIYRRSLYFILIKAVQDLFPERKVIISHSISKGLYCEVRGDLELTAAEVALIEKKMHELVAAKIDFVKKMFSIDEAKSLFEKSGRMDRFHAIEHRNKPYVTLYSCAGYEDYFYGYMVPHTGFTKHFELKFYKPGVIVRFPDKNNPKVLPVYEEQKKLFSIFNEYKTWNKILGVENVGILNDIIQEGGGNELIRIQEALHEKKIAQISDLISGNVHKKRLVIIAGPSSSGKTTFAQRLSIQLRVNGLKPVTISLDDYFVDREHTPRDEKGDYDFEALEAIDVTLFNDHLARLIAGEEVEIPVFNFPNGRRNDTGRKLIISEENILVIEGIHGLNEKLTSSIPKESKFKVYVSALTSMNIDDHNRIPTTDTRILRRIVRDFNFRGCNALNTIKRWPSVRRGEERNIFPFQEEADVMFNSYLIFELSVLKAHAEPLLSEIDRANPEYSEARRLIEFLSYFKPVDPKEIPLNSIMREFIGEAALSIKKGNSDALTIF